MRLRSGGGMPTFLKSLDGSMLLGRKRRERVTTTRLLLVALKNGKCPGIRR